MSTSTYTNDEKSVNLSPLEHKVYFRLYEGEVFRTGDAYKIIANRKTARQILSRLKKKGYVKQIRRGLFAVVPAQMIGRDFAADKILIASQLAKTYFISHHTALELHGAAQSYLNIVYLSSGKASKSFEFQSILYKFVTAKRMFGIKQVLRGSQKINVSDNERTILDCIRNMEYGGGLEEIVKSISAYPNLNYTKLMNYLNLFGEKSMFHRTGFIFDELKNELNVPESFLAALEKGLGKRVYYLVPKEKGVYIGKWKLIVPKNAKEMMKIA
ncbi:MAG: type IV toxin-antitoxin system AbiEi family antitoxin [Nanoarchaeota archaeon]|nr:hypothetical protein [Nanoarchaeota archaeon]MBU4451482.1 hypothetical protein [Nanoarchaeota archaeon]MCG2723867.1 hypothetical protein [archaeon]